jgi:ankyrin repeat protein
MAVKAYFLLLVVYFFFLCAAPLNVPLFSRCLLTQDPTFLFHAETDALTTMLQSIRFMKMTTEDLEDVTVADVSQLSDILRKHPELARKRDKSGWTLLQKLTRYCKGSRVAECVQLLLQAHSAAAQQETPEKMLPLHFVLAYMGGSAGTAECVRLLLKAHPEAARRQTLDGWLPLQIATKHMSCGTDATECLRLLLQEYPAAAKERTADGLLPLHFLARSVDGSLEAANSMRLLLQAHPLAAREIAKGFLPLHLLAENDAQPPVSVAIVRLLVAASPRALHTHDKNGCTPLHAAEHWKRLSADALAELRRLTEGEIQG